MRELVLRLSRRLSARMTSQENEVFVGKLSESDS